MVTRSRKAPDLAKEVGPSGIRQLLQLMCDAYHDLLESDYVKTNTPENEITEQWYIYILAQWRRIPSFSVKITPIHQKEDPTKGKRGKRFPTIDFCFRADYFPESYFGAECKLLDEGNRRHLLEYASKNGIGRFIDGRYSSKSSAGAMVGYIRVGCAEKCACDVRSCISKLPNTPKLMKVEPIGRFKDIYESLHRRTSGVSPFKIFHSFYTFESS